MAATWATWVEMKPVDPTVLIETAVAP